MNFTQNFNAKEFLKNQNIPAYGGHKVGEYFHKWTHTVLSQKKYDVCTFEILLKTRCSTCKPRIMCIPFYVEDYHTAITFSDEVLDHIDYDYLYCAVDNIVKKHNAYMLELHVAAKNLC